MLIHCLSGLAMIVDDIRQAAMCFGEMSFNSTMFFRASHVLAMATQLKEGFKVMSTGEGVWPRIMRSEEHTSELQSRP